MEDISHDCQHEECTAPLEYATVVWQPLTILKFVSVMLVLPSIEESSFDRIDFMDQHEQNEWVTKHIPHRVRAAVARLNMEDSILGMNALIDPALRTDEDRIYWRCSTDSIWEGRLAATRWLIEFVGIKRGNDGNPVASTKKGKDVRIDDLEGGRLLDPSTPRARRLANVWKGCSQASSHATNAYSHPPIDDQKVLPEALKIILDHLQSTIYDKASKKLRDCVMERVA
jgi:hypothetical protein